MKGFFPEQVSPSINSPSKELSPQKGVVYRSLLSNLHSILYCLELLGSLICFNFISRKEDKRTKEIHTTEEFSALCASYNALQVEFFYNFYPATAKPQASNKLPEIIY
jgi:hypothetical protein